MMDLAPYSKCPFRSPKAISYAIKDIIQDKIVCELGCAEGDNLGFMSEYTSKVFGMENMRERYEIAQKRGFKVIIGDYHKDPIPDAEVFYFWPNDGQKDNEFLVNKILSKENFHGTIVVAGDTGFPREIPSVKKVGNLGKIVEVKFNEGTSKRQHGSFLLAIIEADEARCKLQS